MKLKLLTIILFIVIIFEGNAFALDNDYDELIKNQVDIWVNGEIMDTYDEKQQIDLPAFIFSERTMLPLRKTFSIFGVEPVWDPKDRSIMAEYMGKTLWLQVDNPIIRVNGIEESIDVPAKLFHNRTYVPIRKIFEALGMDIQWDDINRRVLIETSKELYLDEFDFTIQHNSDFVEAASIRDKTKEIHSITNPNKSIIILEYDSSIDTSFKMVKEQFSKLDFRQISSRKKERILYSEFEEDFRGNIVRIFLTEKDDKSYLWYFNNMSYDEGYKIVNSIYFKEGRL